VSLPDALRRLGFGFAGAFSFGIRNAAFIAVSKFSLAFRPSMYSYFIFTAKSLLCREHNTEHMPEKNDASTEKQSTSPILSSGKEDPITRKRTNDPEGKEANPRPHWADRIIAIFTGLIFLTYIASNYFACRQMKLTKTAIEQSAANNSSAIIAQQGIAQHALAESQKSVDKSLGATIDNFHLDQRAWIAAMQVAGKPELDKPLEIIVTVKNTGKTFAKEFTNIAISEPVPRGKRPDFAKGGKQRDSVSVIAPNGEYLMRLYPIKGSPTEKLNQFDFDALTSGDITLFVHGRLIYNDIFGCPHWTTFCTKMTRSFLWESCSVHNDADDNRCPAK
jgi:hypothetical protein